MNNKKYVENYKDYERYVNVEAEEENNFNYRGVNHKYELTRCDLYFIDFLIDNNYSIKVKKQVNSKSVFEISKDGVTTKYEVMSGTNYDGMYQFCETFEDYFRKEKIIASILKK